MSTDSSTTLQTFTCANCGATTSFDPRTQTLRCPFCGTEAAVRATAAGATVPEDVGKLVLPFSIDKDASIDSVRTWLGKSFFAPSDLQSRSTLDRGQGAYVPFWRLDADASSEWEGEVSETHTREVSRQFTDSGGNSGTRMETEEYKTWHPRSGTHEGNHRAWVTGSTGLTQVEGDQLMPFPEEGMLTYSADAIAGYSVEEPGVDVAGAWAAGDPKIQQMEHDACAVEVERLTRVDTRLSNRQAAVCYLPVWLFNYRYDNADYRVLVNGRTGEIVGKRPTSRQRVVLTIAAIVLAIALIVILILLLR
ncbi:MAG TPA: hypothetical protein PLR44_14790 [Thermomicrobiales bacterium]|nr:hypothetical protein [Chloroflexota bacterium]HQZ91318.1 hypothetical protein [Thermomicrobiales bacterium]